MNRSLFAALLLCAVSSCGMNPAFARHYAVDPSCNITMPCEGVTTSPRGERVVRAMRGLGVAKQVYRPDSGQSAVIVGRPRGCPARQWCGCWLASYLGIPDRSLWLAANWAHVGHSAGGPQVGAIVVWRHHVGKITGVDGNRILVLSGNDGHAVRERWRTTSGVIAYRVAG